MPEKRNYLLGNGEKLARNEPVKIGFGEGHAPYTVSEAKASLAPLAAATIKVLDALPDLACPHDEAVAVLTLHPKYLSKSAYPKELLRASGLRAVGSKPVTITPRKSHLRTPPAPSASADLFIAGSRNKFREFSRHFKSWSSESPKSLDLIKVENLHAVDAAERVKQFRPRGNEILFEVVLHAGENKNVRYILDAFEAFLEELDIEVDLDQRIDASELSFLPVRASATQINQVAKFSFLRLAREMPVMRDLLLTTVSTATKTKPFPYSLPEGSPLDPKIRVAVFDGGQPSIPQFKKWVKRIAASGTIGPVDTYQKHGLAVASALLFGSIEADVSLPRPYAKVDHYRVLDEQTAKDRQSAVYPVLKRIIGVLEKNHYDFVNFSIGPSVAIDDDDVHPWTAKIDPLLASGKTLAAIAVGNGGENDVALRLNRIQTPSDCVNALSVGASDGFHDSWKRAPYSSVGHGRCPGVIKPDGVVPGGVATNPFWVVGNNGRREAVPTKGTSFAAPAALRTAIGVRAHLGPVITPLALKALLIHHADAGTNEAWEVGWGQFPADIEKLVTCTTGKAHIVYQGTLDPKKFLRAVIPMPEKKINGFVTIKATICFATGTDPEHPLTYTRSGLLIYFRKDRFDIPAGRTNPKSSGFFKTGLGMSEQLIRSDAHQWETVRRETKRMQGNKLSPNPCFDIHYNPRSGGHDTDGDDVPYAMVVTVDAPAEPELFEKIFKRYQFQLSELKPRIDIPIRVR